jgi:Domain of unknown function (DUF4384)
MQMNRDTIRMRTISPRLRPRLAIAVGAAAILLGACETTTQATRRDVLDATAQVSTAPQASPVKTVTSFNSALRCMDNLMIDYGVKSVSVLVEDLQDSTKKVSAGTKDMLISAVSDMTRRSNAVRLVAYGADSANVIGFLKEAERKSAYQNVPEFGIRGSISQLDENLARKSAEVGVSIAGVGGGTAKSASTQILGLDLTMLRTEDLSIIPGVTSRNSVVILREGTGSDAEAAYKKFGITYSVSLAKSEGTAQALRNLIELAGVELFGRLLKLPYWTCLGADASSEAVRTEIQDWYYSLYGKEGELIAYFQWQFKVRGVYDGEIDGQPNEALRDAVTAYRIGLGLAGQPQLDMELFSAYLQAAHGDASAKARRYLATLPPRPARPPVAVASASKPAASTPTTADTLELSLSSNQPQWSFQRGEEMRLSVSVNRAAHLYCYLEDESGAVQRFFPNRFVPDAKVTAGQPMLIPGTARFKLEANRNGQKERILCVAAARDVLLEMPAKVVGNDFNRLPVQRLEEVLQAYERIGDVAVSIRMVDVLVR